jgi:hypothetical protein
MHPETLRGPSQAQQFHVHEIKQDQYGSLSDTLSLLKIRIREPSQETARQAILAQTAVGDATSHVG